MGYTLRIRWIRQTQDGDDATRQPMKSATEMRRHAGLNSLVPIGLACAAIASPWLLKHSPVLGLRRGFALVCHQRPDRSLVLLGGTVAVCARCLGIYLGVALGALVRVAHQFAMRLFLAVGVINLIDWLAELSGLHGNWMFERFAVGFALGASAAMLVVASAGEVKIRTQAKAA